MIISDIKLPLPNNAQSQNSENDKASATAVFIHVLVFDGIFRALLRFHVIIIIMLLLSVIIPLLLFIS